jgi:hypothetical protein
MKPGNKPTLDVVLLVELNGKCVLILSLCIPMVSEALQAIEIFP